MKKILMLAMLSLVACKEIPGNSSNPQMEERNYDYQPEEKSTSLEGQAYYTTSEIIEGEEAQGYQNTNLAEYELSQIRVYLVGQKRIYKLFPDYDGVFFQDDIVPGSYQVIIKTPEKFQDKNGEYTYQGITTFKVVNGKENKLGVVHVRKVYLEMQTEKEIPAPVTEEQAPELNEEDLQMINEGELQ